MRPIHERAGDKRVLIVSLLDNIATISSLPQALSKTGFDVAALCSKDFSLARSRFLSRIYPLPEGPNRNLFDGLLRAARDWRPALMVPADDNAVSLFHMVMLAKRPDLRPFQDLVARSSCSRENHRFLVFKSEFYSLARGLGIPVPETVVVRSVSEAAALAGRGWSYPVVLKKDLGWAGNLVALCRNRGELGAAFRRLNRSRPPAPPGSPARITMQKFIEGKSAFYAFSSGSGRLLAGVAAQVERQHPEPTGPSTVFRIIRDPRLAAVCRRVVRKPGYTGFGGLDFVLERGTGRPFVLEFNPRPITACSLGAESGVDLLLPNHGAVTAGRSIRYAMYRMIVLERMARRHLEIFQAARALGRRPKPIPRGLALRVKREAGEDRRTEERRANDYRTRWDWRARLAKMRASDPDLFRGGR